MVKSKISSRSDEYCHNLTPVKNLSDKKINNYSKIDDTIYYELRQNEFDEFISRRENNGKNENLIYSQLIEKYQCYRCNSEEIGRDPRKLKRAVQKFIKFNKETFKNKQGQKSKENSAFVKKNGKVQ